MKLSFRVFTQFLFEYSETMTEMLKQVQHDVQSTIDKLIKFVTLNLFQGLNKYEIIRTQKMLKQVQHDVSRTNVIQNGFKYLKKFNIYFSRIRWIFFSLKFPEYTSNVYFSTNGSVVETGTVLFPGQAAFCMLFFARKIQFCG